MFSSCFIIIIWARFDNLDFYGVQAQELLANITLLEVAVFKLEEQSSILQSEVGQARTEREIAELRVYSAESAHFRLEGSNLHLTSSGSNRTRRDDHTIKLPGIEFDSDSQRLKSNATPISIETTPRQFCVPLGSSAPEKKSELGQPQSDSKVCSLRSAFIFSC